MRIERAWWIVFGLTSLAWFAVEPGVFKTATFIAFRDLMVQYSGLLAMACMSIAMVLAIRPQWPEKWFGGLDKMYRLHKWLGISALVLTVVHWSWSNAPKWAGTFGLLERVPHGPRPKLANPIAQWFMDFRGAAELIGEWAFYVATLLIVLALVKWFPYRLFYKTHRLLAVAYLALVLHVVFLTKFDYWLSPVGLLFVPLLAIGAWAAIIVLLRRVAAGRQVRGKIASMQYFPSVRSLEVAIDVPEGWFSHLPGQFVFVTSDTSEGAHPYTIASAWNENERRIVLCESDPNNDPTPESPQFFEIVRKDQNLLGSRIARNVTPLRKSIFFMQTITCAPSRVGSCFDAFSHLDQRIVPAVCTGASYRTGEVLGSRRISTGIHCAPHVMVDHFN